MEHATVEMSDTAVGNALTLHWDEGSLAESELKKAYVAWFAARHPEDVQNSPDFIITNRIYTRIWEDFFKPTPYRKRIIHYRTFASEISRDAALSREQKRQWAEALDTIWSTLIMQDDCLNPNYAPDDESPKLNPADE